MTGRGPSNTAESRTAFPLRNHYFVGVYLGFFGLLAWLVCVFFAFPIFTPMTEADYLPMVVSCLAGPVFGVWVVARLLMVRHYRTLLGFGFGLGLGVLWLVIER